MTFSQDFLKKYAQIAAQNQQQAAATTGVAGEIDVKTKKEKGGRVGWNYSLPTDVDVVVYDPYSGKAFPSPSVARDQGVTRFVYNLPPGMKIDWSYWEQFSQPKAPVAGAGMPIADQTLPFKPEPYSPNEYPAAQTAAPASNNDDGPAAIDYTNTSADYWRDIAANRADEVWIPNLEKTGAAQTVGGIAKAAGIRAVTGSNYASNDTSQTQKEIVVARRDRMGVLPGNAGYDPNTYEGDPANNPNADWEAGGGA
jgi:hypothetical protein